MSSPTEFNRAIHACVQEQDLNVHDSLTKLNDMFTNQFEIFMLIIENKTRFLYSFKIIFKHLKNFSIYPFSVICSSLEEILGSC